VPVFDKTRPSPARMQAARRTKMGRFACVAISFRKENNLFPNRKHLWLTKGFVTPLNKAC
jgi:predicted NAD/FAD-dependent oxidoreductase